jgi:hypothetical protein
MRRHDLRVFERAASLQISRDAGCSKRVTADLDLHAALAAAALDHASSVDAVHSVAGELAGATASRAEEGAPFVAGDAGGTNVLIEEGFELVVRRHLVSLAAFFVEADPPALAVGESSPRPASTPRHPRVKKQIEEYTGVKL